MINWKALTKFFKNWIKNPEHKALLIWLIFVAAGLIMFFLLVTGLLNGAIPSSRRRKNWIEVNNQILNALFTIIVLYEHPRLFHQLVILLRWRGEDQAEIRKVYCKNGIQKPNDWAHMMLVVILFHITCFAQYTLCGLYWGYTRTTRPEWAENLAIVIGIVSPVIAGFYIVYSPLGRIYDEQQESQNAQNPEWVGGLLDCTDDPTLSCLSFFCTCYVFGWNAGRLGFGDMYVHIFTFALVCVAPLVVFAIAALKVDNEAIKLILVMSGSLLSVSGLLYGGFWRTEMRKKFKLPANTFCFGSSTLTDYMQWLFCWSCSLAQEVRTANFYDGKGNGFGRKEMDAARKIDSNPLPEEDNPRFMTSNQQSFSCTPIDSGSFRSQGRTCFTTNRVTNTTEHQLQDT
ncbi:Cell number regulator 5 [Apostasia shenzhenica]|uniref:Cell number regulator 5 n=1 Tax=Apostasia shenzhenica TaxID=1088818 RepID=A0A2I0BHH7_9ASPA|nr:Cell number regulator 5 [Apostasia shenzhenica]